MKLILEVENYDIEQTLKPSFVFSLFRKIGRGEFVKVAGHLSGMLRYRQLDKHHVEAFSTANLSKEELKELSELHLGLWHEPFEDLFHSLPRSKRQIIEGLASIYPGVRIPITRELEYVTIAVFLSRRTDYYRFVLPWCYRIWERYGHDVQKIAEASVEELMMIGRSYQIRQLKKLLQSFFNIPLRVKHLPYFLKEFAEGMKNVRDLLSFEPEVARMIMLNSCYGIGPKTADSILLSTFKAPYIIPCDTHLEVVSKRLKLANGILPRKDLCMKYVCNPSLTKLRVKQCPLSLKGLCLRSTLFSCLRELGGYVQTLIYLFGYEFCRKKLPRCTNCRMKSFCSSFR